MIKLALILCFITASSSVYAQTSFSGTQTRIIGSLDIVRFLNAKFKIPLDPSSMYYFNHCQKLDFSRHIILGTVLPKAKKRLVDKPGQNYVQWYLNCVESFARDKLNYYDVKKPEEMKEFIGINAWNWLKREDKGFFIINAWKKLKGEGHVNKDPTTSLKEPWTEFPVERQHDLIENILFFLVGPEFVLLELNYIGDQSVIQSSPKNLEELISFLLKPPIQFEELEQAPTIRDAIIYYSTLILSVGEIITY